MGGSIIRNIIVKTRVDFKIKIFEYYRRVCVIVNDMASLNIDASLIRNTKLIQTAEKMVELQNGCICCTLRDDLLQEVGALARSGKFDYLVIDSTGISEPMQVAETFTMDFEDSQGTQALSELALLDTCVTVVDATNLLLNACVVFYSLLYCPI